MQNDVICDNKKSINRPSECKTENKTYLFISVSTACKS